ncbi:hypothetical protein ABN763_14380 [Spongiivirga sp. MCCC 1A20706]|uniref:hypothetical protein n=1 Tax=Spongiivirga sp. MCCC 1A20706 TaxID=3160963 RepID=UPI003977B277
MNQLLILGSLVFWMNTPTDTTNTVINYIDVETVSYVCNEETNAVEPVIYIEQEEEIELGFDTAEYLPVGFDPYAESGQLTEDEVDALFEEEIELGFDTAEYLPADFDPYQEVLTDEEIDALFEEEITIEFNTRDYLPKDFNPYEAVAMIK